MNETPYGTSEADNLGIETDETSKVQQKQEVNLP